MSITELPDERDAILETEERERFRINDDSAAIWAMRKLAEVQKAKAENEKLATAEKHRIDYWLEEVQRPLERNAVYFANLLTDYAIRQREESDRKSIVLPHGKISTRNGADKWVTDNDTVLEWLRANNKTDLIRTKEEPALAALKAEFVVDGEKVITRDGEVVPGIVVHGSNITVSIQHND